MKRELKEFEEWLQNNTSLLARSRNQYLKVIRLFLRKYGEASVENINRFLSEKNISFYKFAFKHYLKFLGKDDDYALIIKLKKKPKQKFGFYADKDRIKNMIEYIEDRRYYMVAKIQYLTGARTHDVLTLKRENVEIKKDCIVLHLITKGERMHIVAIPFPEAEEILEFLKEMPGEYPFLRGYSEDFDRWVNNNYRYYYEQIRNAATIVGMSGFTPHDFRRNFATDAYRETKDIYLTRDLLGHRNIDHTIIYLKSLDMEKRSKEIIEKIRR